LVGLDDTAVALFNASLSMIHFKLAGTAEGVPGRSVVSSGVRYLVIFKHLNWFSITHCIASFSEERS
jgi:hypothetical protein